MTSPEVSWLFFKAQAKRPYLNHMGRASNAEKQPTGSGLVAGGGRILVASQRRHHYLRDGALMRLLERGH